MSTDNTGNTSSALGNSNAATAVLSLSDMLQNIADANFDANAAAELDTPRSDVSSVTSQHSADFARSMQTPTTNTTATLSAQTPNASTRNPWRCFDCGTENGASSLDCVSCLRSRYDSNLRRKQSITDKLGRDLSAVEQNVYDALAAASAAASGVLPASRSQFSLSNPMLPTNQVTPVNQAFSVNQVTPVNQQVTTEITRPSGSTAVFTPSVSPVIRPAVAPVTPTNLTMSATSSTQTPLVRGTPVMTMPGMTMPGMTSTPIMTRHILLPRTNRTQVQQNFVDLSEAKTQIRTTPVTPVTPVFQVNQNTTATQSTTPTAQTATQSITPMAQTATSIPLSGYKGKNFDSGYKSKFLQAKQQAIQVQQQQNAFLAQHQQATQQPQNAFLAQHQQDTQQLQDQQATQQATQQPQSQQATQQATVILPNLTPVALGTQSVGSATSTQPADATTTFKLPTFQTTDTQSATITSIASQPATMDVSQTQPVVISTTNTKTPGISTTVTQTSAVPVNTTIPATIDTTTTRSGILATTATHTMVPSLNISQATSLSPRSATGTLYVDSQPPTPTGAGLYGIQGSLTTVSGTLQSSKIVQYAQILDDDKVTLHEGEVVYPPDRIPLVGDNVMIRDASGNPKTGKMVRIVLPNKTHQQPTAQAQQPQPIQPTVQVQYSQPTAHVQRQPTVQVQSAVQPVQVQYSQPTVQQPSTVQPIQVQYSQPVQQQPAQYQIPNAVAPLPVAAPLTTASSTFHAALSVPVPNIASNPAPVLAPATIVAPITAPLTTAPATIVAPITVPDTAPITVPRAAPLQSVTAIIPTGTSTVNTTVSAAGNTFSVPAGAMNMPTLVGTGASVPTSQLVTILTSNGTVVSGALLPNQALSTSTPPTSIPQTHIDSFNKIVLYVNQTLSATMHPYYTSRTDVFNNTPYRIATYKDGSRVINGEVIVPPNIQDDIGKLMVSARNKLSMLVSLWHYNVDYMVGTLLIESPWKLCQYLESQGAVIIAGQEVDESDLITHFLDKKNLQLMIVDHSASSYVRQLGMSDGKVLDVHLSDKKPNYYLSGNEFPDSIITDLHLFYPSIY